MRKKPGKSSGIEERLIDAYLHGRREALRALLDEMGADHALHDACRALLDAVEHGLSFGARPRAIDQAFSRDVGSPDVLVCLLGVLSRHTHAARDVGSMRRLVGRMEVLLPQLGHWRLKCVVRRHQHWLAGLRGDFEGEKKYARLGMEQAEEASDTWLEFLVKYGNALVDAGDLDAARGVVDRLSNREILLRVERSCGAPVRETVFDYWMACGNAAEALKWVTDPDVPEHSYLRYGYGCLRAKALTTLEEFGLARGELDETRDAFNAGGEAAVGSPFQAELRNRIMAGYAFLALVEKRFDECRLYLQTLREQGDNPDREFREATEVTVGFDLCCRRKAGAETALGVADPEGAAWRWALDRARLCLLKGDRAGGERHFGRVLAVTSPAYVEMCMVWCHELGPRDVCGLFGRTVAPRVRRVDAVAPTSRSDGMPLLIGESEIMCRTRREIDQFATLPADHPILLVGETGTGKDIAARMIHQRSANPGAAFVALNCAAIPDALAEAELFGHTKGAFTGATETAGGLVHAAGTGTVFLDEVNSMSTRVQGLLLRVLETGEYRPVGSSRTHRTQARFVLASNENLEEAVKDRRFRADLYYRLTRFCVFMPPLRDHREDIPLLCDYFMRGVLGSERTRFSGALMNRFLSHTWPGNVRELRNEVERLVLLNGQLEEIPEHLTRIRSENLPAPPLAAPGGGAGAMPADTRQNETLLGEEDERVPGIPAARRRRRAILALFGGTPRLYRRDVSEQIGCSPGTATQDLRALEEAGLIRRVETSGHLRTSYFVRVTSGKESG